MRFNFGPGTIPMIPDVINQGTNEEVQVDDGRRQNK